MSVLFVPSCTQRVAATRYRVYQYLPHLERQGVRTRVLPAVSDSTTRLMLISPTLSRWRRFAYYLRLTLERLLRFLPLLWLASRYRVVFLQRTTFPWGLERVLKRINPNIIFDFDDSIYMSNPDDREAGFLARFKNKIKASEVAGILRASRCAITDADELRNYARRHCPEALLIPGPIDIQRNFVNSRVGGPMTLGWIGSPSTSAYLPILAGPLSRISRAHGVQVKLIGAGPYRFEGVETLSLDWCLDREVADLQSFDIGVMPMPDTDWTKGKLGVKMLLYMAVGVPAVVSYTSTNAGVIEDGVNGFLARSEDEWVEKLSALIADPALRKRIGLAGRRTVEERFSVEAGLPQIMGLLERLA